ncbi:hypothetical protein KFK09_022188 [Dendrobium nobile]|uniref:Uncharacterized protein n=1 Tax=Dendrobium nobile TaxID=94219 RepID=A0A8T3AIN6_DENNO|nr:hypothetical protein KFK09_022188 [Dendrobium nobile]
MAGKKVEALEGEFGQLKTDLEGKFMEISTNNERLEGRFAAMEEMMKKLLEMKTHPDTSEVRETTDGHGVGGNPNPIRGRRNPEVEILEGDDDMPPLEPFSREEISTGNDRRGADFQRRGADFQRRGAEFQRRGVDFGSRRGNMKVVQILEKGEKNISVDVLNFSVEVLIVKGEEEIMTKISVTNVGGRIGTLGEHLLFEEWEVMESSGVTEGIRR